MFPSAPKPSPQPPLKRNFHSWDVVRFSPPIGGIRSVTTKGVHRNEFFRTFMSSSLYPALLSLLSISLVHACFFAGPGSSVEKPWQSGLRRTLESVGGDAAGVSGDAERPRTPRGSRCLEQQSPAGEVYPGRRGGGRLAEV